MKGKAAMGKIIQKAKLTNTGDLAAVQEGRAKPDPKKRTLEGNPQYDGKMVVDLL